MAESLLFPFFVDVAIFMCWAFVNCCQALTKFLKSVNWKVVQEAKQALDLLHKWSPMDVDDALELLSPVFENPVVRKYAVTRLQQADDDVSQFYVQFQMNYTFFLLIRIFFSLIFELI